MTYNWNTFNLDDAEAGALVGIQVGAEYDLTYTGHIYKLTRFVGEGGYFLVKMNGYVAEADLNGRITKCTPSNADLEGITLQIVTTDMGDNAAVGSAVTRSSGSSGSGRSSTAVLSTMEPRDHFAMNALNAMLTHTEHPETLDDATCLMYSLAAYRWAQAMMIAAADSREGTSTSQGGTTQEEVNAKDLQSNTEKILYNMNESLKDIRKQMEEVVKVSIDGAPEVDEPDSPSEES